MIRKLTQEEYNNAADLSYQVYMECGRNDFTQEGIETFKSFVYDTYSGAYPFTFRQLIRV